MKLLQFWESQMKSTCFLSLVNYVICDIVTASLLMNVFRSCFHNPSLLKQNFDFKLITICLAGSSVTTHIMGVMWVENALPMRPSFVAIRIAVSFSSLTVTAAKNSDVT